MSNSFAWLAPSINQRDREGRAVRRISIFILALLLITPMVINATERNETGITLEALPDDVTATWTAINNGLTNAQVYALTIDPSNTSIIYAVTQNSGIFKSTDWGGSWSAINSGLTNSHGWALAIDPSHTSTIYAGTNGGAI